MNSSVNPTTHTSVLLVLPDADNRALLSSILQQSGLRTFLCGRCRDAIELLPFVSIVIAEHDLPDGTWLDILQSSQQLMTPPAVIVTSRLAGVELWAEVLNHGGFDLLAQPFHNADVLWSVQSAVSHAEVRRRRSERDDPPRAGPRVRYEAPLCLIGH